MDRIGIIIYEETSSVPTLTLMGEITSDLGGNIVLKMPCRIRHRA